MTISGRSGDKNNQALHDKVGKTYVVRAGSTPESAQPEIIQTASAPAASGSLWSQLGDGAPPAGAAAPLAASPPPAPPSPQVPAGWYADPYQQATYRYWDGQAWTEHTN